MRNAASPMQLGEDATGPEGDEGAEHGILDDAGKQLDAAREHRLDDDRYPDPRSRRRDGVGVRQVEGDPAGLRLVRAGGCRLDDGREAELPRERHRLVDRGRDPLRDEG